MATPEEIKKARKNAEEFDKQRDSITGQESPKKDSEAMKEREGLQKMRNENTRNSYLKKFIRFSEDPLDYLEELCASGEWANSLTERTQLFNLITQVEIQQNLREIINLLSKRK